MPNPTRKDFTADNVTYTFRVPTAKDMIQIDLKARELREGVTDGLGVGFSYSQSCAMLGQLCENPQNVDFGDLQYDVLDELAGEVTAWINSFRRKVDDKQGPVGTPASE